MKSTTTIDVMLFTDYFRAGLTTRQAGERGSGVEWGRGIVTNSIWPDKYLSVAYSHSHGLPVYL